LGEAIQKIRKISYELSPKTLLDFGLQSAMGEMEAKLQNGGIKVDGQLYGPESNLMKSEKFLVYRICQELRNNSLKHSHGTHIRIVAKVEGTKATVTAIDKGDGFHTTGGEVFHLGSGLARIREAVRVRFGTVKLKNTQFGTLCL
jgi:two-component system NarL family sensor kinase